MNEYNCIDCSSGNHERCEDHFKFLCSCWRTWHGENPVKQGKVKK